LGGFFAIYMRKEKCVWGLKLRVVRFIEGSRKRNNGIREEKLVVAGELGYVCIVGY
jgi:hypothetical protein